MRATREDLAAAMDFDHPIEVHPDGTITDAPGWAPEVTVDGDHASPNVDSMAGTTWELLNGYSGQWSHVGPIMHPSEYIGGRMADDILNTPGIYCAVVVTDLNDSDDAGWAVARLVTDRELPDSEWCSQCVPAHATADGTCERHGKRIRGVAFMLGHRAAA